jgi:L-cysteate sulfo-lyase
MHLTRIPHIALAHRPTPLEPLARLTEALGGPRLLVKRDDCTGLAGGGNKTRKLEYLLANALAEDADTVITAGGVQSNHVRQTAAAAARLGLEAHLVLARIVPGRDAVYEHTGNVLLDRLLGAHVHLHPADCDRAAVMAALAEELRTSGRRPYVIPVGGSNGLGALGYAACAGEIDAQAQALGLAVDAVVLPCSSGGTQAGLVTGFARLGAETRVIGIDVDAGADRLHGVVQALAEDVAALLELDGGVPADAVKIEAGYAGEAYGLPTAEMVAAVELTARTEGLILDPVYTGKAMAGLVGLIRDGAFRRDDTVVFLHTGGLPALFAYPSEFPA